MAHVITVRPALDSGRGASFVLDDRIAAGDYTLHSDTARATGPLRYRLQVTHVGDGVLVAGTARVTVVGECSRCAESFQADITASINELYTRDPIDDPDDPLDLYDAVIDSEGNIDIEPMLVGELRLNIPVAPLCQPDCAGVCPGCGANLNRDDCACAADAIDPNHPFAALADLIKD
ncbi:MAG: DUF177 domain-containing protein [Actinomycetes bacterium]|jgi:uncharacterized protein|nr:DUF177 domain-containing protein [Actinomycetes bacterium]